MPVIDKTALTQLGELIGGDHDALRELVETFIEEGADILGEMQSAVSSMDTDSLRRGAHSLKSSAQDFGAGDVAAQAAALEARATASWPESALGDVSDLRSAFELARTELSDWLVQNPT